MAEPIVVERVIDAPAQETFELFTDPEQLRRWQALSAAVDLRVGGDFRFTITPGHIAEGTYTEVDPGRRVVFTWGWVGQPLESTVVVELEPEGEATRVRLTHNGLAGDVAAGHDEGWQHYLHRLSAAVSDGDAGHDPWAQGPEALDDLTAAETAWGFCRDVLRRITAEHRDLATPCEEFTTHQLIEHLIGSVRAIGAMAGQGEIDEPTDAGSAEDGVARVVEPALAAWRARGVDGEVPFGEGMIPATVPVGILSLEFLVHAWDLARAIGADIVVPEHVSAHVLGSAHTIIRPDNRGPGRGFAEALDPNGAGALDELVAFTGRAG